MEDSNIFAKDTTTELDKANIKLLKARIERFPDVFKLWGDIDYHNFDEIIAIPYQNQNMFTYMLTNNFFQEANFIASKRNYFTNYDLSLIFQKHRQFYPKNQAAFNISELVKEFRILKKDPSEDYEKFIPLIYRVINYYYLNTIEIYVENYVGARGLSFAEDQLESLSKELNNFPYDCLDMRYVNTLSENILLNLVKLFPQNDKTSTLIEEIYEKIFNKKWKIPLYLTDRKGNNIFHLIAFNANHLLMKFILSYPLELFTFDESTHPYEHLMKKPNNNEELFYNLIFANYHYPLIELVISMIPVKYLNSNAYSFIRHDELVALDYEIDSNWLVVIIEGRLNAMLDMKKKIIYDEKDYARKESLINKLINKLLQNDEFNFNKILGLLFELDLINIAIKIINKYSSKINSKTLTAAIKSKNSKAIEIMLSKVNYSIDSDTILAAIGTNNKNIISAISLHLSDNDPNKAILKNQCNLLDNHFPSPYETLRLLFAKFF